MNMILHNNPTALIMQGNTLADPKFKEGAALKTFDYVVANPPFSDKRWSTGIDPANDPFDRFQAYGTPPDKQGDYAYLLHIVRSLKSTGKGACILPHGVLFRGNAEAVIRKSLLQRGIIKAIIGLPANLFYGTGIPACIIVVDKQDAHARKGVFMIDASKGFIKDGNKNRLRAQDIHKIVDTFTRQAQLPRYSRMVSLAEIGDPKNDFNLNLPRYIDSTEPEDIQDLEAHLRGGIPARDIDALEAYWQVIPCVRAVLFKKADRPGYSQLRVAATEIKSAIFGHAEFTAFNESAKPRLIIEEKGSKTKEKPDFIVGKRKYKAELIPPALIIARYFAAEQTAIEKLEAEVATIEQEMEEMVEEHGGEGGLLEDAKNEKEKITKLSVAARLKDIKGEPDAADERKVLNAYLVLIEKEAVSSAKLKEAQESLMTQVSEQYSKLTEDEIKTLVVDDKWLATLAATVQGELDRVSQTLTGRIRQLAERYATPLPQLTSEVETLAARVAGHLKKMGFRP